MKRHKPVRGVPPVERLSIEVARIVAHESSEEKFRRLASQLLREAFNAGVNCCSVNKDGELAITAYGSTLRQHITTRRRVPSPSDSRTNNE